VADSRSPFYAKAPPNRGACSFIHPASPANIRFFAEALRAGCLVAIPTETVYGLAAIALDATACRSIFAVKGRPLVDPLIVHSHDLKEVHQLAFCPPEVAALAAAFWPGPLTLVLEKRAVVPDIVTAGKPTVAIRVPRHPVARALLEAVGAPLAAPSANPFGYVSPSTAQHVADSFGDRIPYILDGGACEIGLESTILDISDPRQPQILRPGAITPEAVGKVLGSPVPVRHSRLEITECATAPGTFARHYSPETRLEPFPAGTIPEVAPTEAVVFLQAPSNPHRSGNAFWLSENGDPEEMARTLFALLRQLDKAGYRRIHCELPEATAGGLQMALRDRILRASASAE
jgi:L-threonylcarbamoyladenylate synthase